MAKIEKNRYWGFIMYPDSAPNNWKDILELTGLPIAISPLHRDFNPDDSEKKPHWHVLLAWDGPTTCAVAQRISDSVNASNVRPIASVRGMYRYHCHLDNPEKVQYSNSERVLLNGFNIYNYTSATAEEEVIMSKEIMKIIVELGIMEYWDLMVSLEDRDLQLFDYAAHHVMFCKALIDSKRHRNKDLAKKDLSQNEK